MSEHLENSEIVDGGKDQSDGWTFELAGMKIASRRRGDSDARAFEVQLTGLTAPVVLVVLGLAIYWCLHLIDASSDALAFLWVVLGVMLAAELLSSSLSAAKKLVARSRSVSAHSAAGSNKLVRVSSCLLPTEVRERHLDEWLDDLQCRREHGERVWLAALGIVLRSVLPLSVREIGARTKRRILGR